MPLYGAEEVQVSLIRYPSVNDKDLPVNDCRNGQKAENVLKQLEDLTAMSLHAITHRKRNFTLIHPAPPAVTVINYMLHPAECAAVVMHIISRIMT